MNSHRGGCVVCDHHTDGAPWTGSYRWVTLVVGVSFPSASTSFAPLEEATRPLVADRLR